MKQVFYLQDEPLATLQNDFEPVIWVYRWNGRYEYSTALKELLDANYNEN